MALPLTATVSPPSNTSASDGSISPLIAGKQGDVMVSELHGKWLTQTYRGKVFMTAGAAAGVTIPVSTSTSPTFTIYNPIGSGVVAELIQIDIGLTNATTVVSPILLGIITNLIVAPTAVTAMAVVNANLGLQGGAASNIVQVYSAATLAAAATKFYGLFSISATSGAFPNFNYPFDGSLLIQPGSLVHVCGTAAQTSASKVDAKWVEIPI